MSQTPFHVLLSSAGRRVALLEIFRKTLADLSLAGEVLAADVSPLSAASRVADRAFRVPRCTSPDFVPEMLRICKEQSVSLVVPTIDTELPAYAGRRDDFARIGTTVAISSPETVSIGADKSRTHEWLTRGGFPTVRQGTAADVLRDLRGWTFPVIVKPRFGSASIDVRRLDKPRELAILQTPARYVVESIARGIEHTVDVLVGRAGRCLCAVPRRRLEVRSGEVSKGMTFRSPALQSLAARIAEALPGAFGVLNIQLFFDEPTGAASVIEINPRFGGGFPLAWQAGADLARWLVQDVAGLPSDARPDSWEDRLVMLRYDAAVFAGAADLGLA